MRTDRYEINVLVNGLYAMRGSFGEEQLAVIEDLILRLIDVSETMEPRGKKRTCFKIQETYMARRCMID